MKLTRKRVILVGPPADRARSMNRYFEHLLETYRDLDFDVLSLRPKTNSIMGSRRLGLIFGHLAISLRLLTVSPTSHVHISDHSDAFYTLFALRSPTIVTCHDLFAVQAMLGEIPEFRPRILGGIYQSLVLRGLRAATSILSVSENTARSVERIVRNSGRRDHVLHNMVEDTFYYPTVENLPDSPGAEQPFILIVGGADWRKRRPLSFRVAKAILDASGSTRGMVVVGPPLTPEEREICRGHHVRVVEQISDAELASLYETAGALVQMSAYEGFCWPVIEANSRGTIAVCADLDVLKEVAPDNIFLAVGESLDRVWTELKAAKNNQSVRHALVQNSRRFNAENFRSKLAEHLGEVL